jgi:hypothetical protein
MGPVPVDPDERAPRSLAVEVASVDGGGRRGGSRRAALLAAIAVVAVIAVAVASSRVFPVERGPVVSPPAGPSASPAAVVASLAASPVTTPDTSPTDDPLLTFTPRVVRPPLDAAALVAAVAARKDGPIAFVSGILRITPRRCEAGASPGTCFRLSIDGLQGVGVVPDDGLAVPVRQPGAGEILVLLPRAGRLVYLGSMVADPRGIPGIDGLLMQLARQGPLSDAARPTLYEADGRLIRLSHNCPGTASCPPPSWLLGAAQPPDSRVVGVVDATLLAGAPGIPGDALLSSGPFLLRLGTGEGASWVVVAREDQASVLHIVIP